jgi:kinesin family member 4
LEDNPRDKNICWMQKELAKKATKVEDLKARVSDLEDELRAARDAQESKKKKRRQEATFTLNASSPDIFESESDEEFEFNDSFHDPEWRKTPAGKRMKSSSRTTTLLKESLVNGMLANISETSDASSTKRSINGQLKCSCKGSCATKLCGCKKGGNFCSDTCKCSEACVNLPDESKESEGAVGGASGAVEKENEDGNEVESPKRAK